MAIKKLCRVGFFSIAMLFLSVFSAQAADFPGESIQIETRFGDVAGGPSWLLILRDVQTGQITPYLFDIYTRENIWTAVSNTHRFKVIASILQFTSTPHKIHNVCGLEKQVFDFTSLNIRLSGVMTPDRNTFQCQILKIPTYKSP